MVFPRLVSLRVNTPSYRSEHQKHHLGRFEAFALQVAQGPGGRRVLSEDTNVGIDSGVRKGFVLEGLGKVEDTDEKIIVSGENGVFVFFSG